MACSEVMNLLQIQSPIKSEQCWLFTALSHWPWMATDDPGSNNPEIACAPWSHYKVEAVCWCLSTTHEWTFGHVQCKIERDGHGRGQLTSNNGCRRLALHHIWSAQKGWIRIVTWTFSEFPSPRGVESRHQTTIQRLWALSWMKLKQSELSR